MYPPELTAPMSADLTSAGFSELQSAQEVDNALKLSGTTLVVVNSVCGCAAGTCRPGVKLSIEGEKKPDNLTTVFAGVNGSTTAATSGETLLRHRVAASSCTSMQRSPPISTNKT